MMTMDNEEKIKAEARDWLLRLSLGSPTEDERARFAAWCAEDARHAAAYRRFESIWQDAAMLEELGALTTLPPPRDAWWRRMRVSLVVHPLRWAASASLTIVIVGTGFWFLLAPAYYATGTAEVRDIHLSDGSEITLGARSSLEVAFRRHERRVVLTSGVAFFSVTKNPSRPFIVRVDDKEVRDVGTQFEIRRDLVSVRVSVVEGAVEVMQVPDRAGAASREAPRTVRLAARVTQPSSVSIPISAPIPPTPLASTESSNERVLTAGQQVTTEFAGAIPDPHVMPPVDPASWRHGRLVYVDTPLKDIIADANRYSREPIEIADERLANIRISVTCPSDRIDETVSALARSLSLKVERREAGGIVLRARGSGD